MRFAISFSPARAFRLARKITDWPLAYRFALLVLPAGITIALVAIWLGYTASSSTLTDSLKNLTMLEAKLQASTVEATLKQLRHSLFLIAKAELRDPDQFRENMKVFFQDNADLIQEIGFKDPSGKSFLLLRDPGGYRLLSGGDSFAGPYSAFQQLSTQPLQPGEAALYPAVRFDEPSSPGKEQSRPGPVMRMALQSPDTSSLYVIGISIGDWSARLAAMMQPGSGLRLPVQEDSVQLAFFFDLRGWILFEMHNSGIAKYLPDASRNGYSGDLGRTGYDAAFRPWTNHENYWLMVTEAREGRSGSVPAPADKYSTTNVGATGVLCFAPVSFAPNDTSDPVPVGAIAFFETSMLPLHAFMRLANYSLGIVVGTLALFIIMAIRVSKKLARPLMHMADSLSEMTRKGELSLLHGETASEEQQVLQASVNSIISKTMSSQHALEFLKREVQHTRSRLPVDLSQRLKAPQAEAEFGLVGSSALIREVREHVHKAARAGTDVLIWGETGTGKELVAAAIHKASARRDGPYISINCGALDENLLLDALFGHVKGAFTEAKADRKGAFLAANNGTLHLDEVGNASAKVQQALLRALSVRRIRPLGSDEEVSFNTRVVAATNVDLRGCVKEGSFREDLYYRLAIISIETPPLRHRKEDIPELAAFCIHEAALALKRPEAHLSRGALDIMASYDWPGNVREFKNCVTRAMAFVEGDLILPQHITLERDAYSTYAPSPIPNYTPETVSPFREYMPPHPEYMFPGIPGFPSTQHAPGKEHAENAKRQPDAVINEIGYASEQLWPAPPRDMFNPARAKPLSSDTEKNQEAPAPSEGDNAQAPFPVGNRYTSVASGQTAPDRREIPKAPGRMGGTPPSSREPEDSVPSSLIPVDTKAPLPVYGLTIPDNLNERQIRALRLVREQGEITRAQYEASVGKELSSRTAQNDLRELVERGILERVGAGPGTRYTLRTG